MTVARRPDWLRVRYNGGGEFQRLQHLMRDQSLHTVCEEAHCPNIGDCWSRGTATFMILGDTCTRSCGFCAVTSGRPGAIDPLEPRRVALAVQQMDLKHAVITSVNRDDAPDGGAGIFAGCIRAIRALCPETTIEVLIPDFMGDWSALGVVLDARPEILNHNVETVPRLYGHVRPKARYPRSLELLREAKRIDPGTMTKSGLMVGLGETFDEMVDVFRDLRAHEVDILTVGQYLRPDEKHLPVLRYWHPDEFAELKEEALALGFRHVEAGPFVRSSYHADEQAAGLRVDPRRSAGIIPLAAIGEE